LVFKKSRKQTVTPPVARKIAAFPYLDKPAGKSTIEKKQASEDLGITAVDFGNGARLNLKPTDFKDNEVLFTLAFGQGRSSEPAEKPGLGPLAEAVLNESGTGTLTKEDLAEALAGKNTVVRFRVDEAHFSFGGKSVTDELEVMFQLLHAYLIDPGYRQDAYDRVIERFAQKYEALKQSVDGAMELSVRRFLAGGDSRFGLPSFEKFRKNSLKDVRQWIGNALAQGDLELSIVGDFDEKTAIDLAAAYIGALPKKREPVASLSDRQPVFPAGKPLSLTVRTQIPKGLVGVVYQTDDFWDIDKTRQMVILGEVFSDMMRISIREKLGAAYSPYAGNSPSQAYKGFGLFYAMVHVAPEQADVVQEAIMTIASDLGANGITEDQFKRAVDPVLTGVKDLRRTNRYWLNSVLSSSRRHPQKLEWSRTIIEAYASMRKDQIGKLANQYLQNNRAVHLSVMPAKPK
jgi:zinc protease